MTTPTILTAKGLAEIRALQDEHLERVEGRMDLREEVARAISGSGVTSPQSLRKADAAIALVVERCAQVADEAKATWIRGASFAKADHNRTAKEQREDRAMIAYTIAVTIRALSPQSGAAS